MLKKKKNKNGKKEVYFKSNTIQLVEGITTL